MLLLIRVIDCIWTKEREEGYQARFLFFLTEASIFMFAVSTVSRYWYEYPSSARRYVS